MAQSIEDRMAKLGLTIKVKKSTTPWKLRAQHTVVGIATNPKNNPETRELALAELERRASKAPTKA